MIERVAEHPSSAYHRIVRGRENDMLLKTLRFVSLLCAALALGLTLTHDLEIPAQQMLSGANWLTVQHTFYAASSVLAALSLICLLVAILRETPSSFIERRIASHANLL